jgi:hypothetical protein
MNNKELYKLLKKNNLNSNSGFTLTELLVGLFMSIFVIGALGFGLMTVLATSQSENSKVKARTENSRALDFISDEVRRARAIETNATNAPRFTISGATVVLALDIPLINDDVTLDTNSNATVKDERIIYYLKSNSGTNWKGPQVLYRWGPPLRANGEYSPKTGGTTNHWTEEALIDGINNTTVTSPCTTGTATPATPTGFYACITGANTAQLFLTGQTKTASGVNYDSQTNDTQVVARARETLAYKTDKNNSITWNVESLGGKYNCNPPDDLWDMRTDFDNDPDSDSNVITSWSQDGDVEGNGGKQPKPIEVSSEKPLKITSNPELDPPADPADPEDCLSSSEPVPHIIYFDNLATFNGNSNCDADGKNCDDNTKVKGDSDPTVQFFKKGSLVPNYGINYEDQKSLGKFLYDQGRAIPTSNVPAGKTLEEFLNDPETDFKIPASEQDINDYVDSLTGLTADEKIAEKAKFKVLEDDQRIVGFEVGQTETTITKDDGSTEPNPGFDLQDNIFIVTSDIFKKKFDADGEEIKVEY